MPELTSPQFNLITILPIVTQGPTPEQQMLAQLRGRALQKPQYLARPEDLLAAIIHEKGVGGANEAVRDVLKMCKAYQGWQQQMAPLKEVPHIQAYQNDDTKVDLSAVNTEILRVGGYLSSHQILYSGGGIDLDQNICNRPLSTSMHPDVARVHALGKDRQIAILEIRNGWQIKGFAYGTSGNRRFKQEYELLLQSGLCLEQESFRTIADFQVRKYNVTGS
jgi:hypothetical protein